MPGSNKLTRITFVYWVFLLYMVTALLWWFIALQKQNRQITTVQLNQLKHDDPAYFQKAAAIETTADRKTAQYIGEGATFLALILLGAIFIFRATRRQIKLSRQQQNFMMAVTHELKTPIAVAKLNLETLQKRKLDPEKQQQLLTNTIKETDRLNSLCNNILLAARFDTAAYSAAMQELNFSELLTGCIDDFTSRFPGCLVEEKIQEAVYIQGEPALLQMLIHNLLENAMHYADKGATIAVSMNIISDYIHLSVADQGIGIPENEKKKIFDKFYRIGNENTRRQKGTGLGLFLCMKIVQLHKGNISVTDNRPSGSIFVVSVPAI